jgi:transposase-like protein
VRSVSQELGVNESQIHKWKRVALKNGDGSRSGVELAEIEALKKRNRELEMEVEILKKAALITGCGS